MPSSAKMRMKRKSRNKSDIMERMLLSSEMTRLRNDGQYLQSTMYIKTTRIYTGVFLNVTYSGGPHPETVEHIGVSWKLCYRSKWRIISKK